jgi:hypothetical protein
LTDSRVLQRATLVTLAVWKPCESAKIPPCLMGEYGWDVSLKVRIDLS